MGCESSLIVLSSNLSAKITVDIYSRLLADQLAAGEDKNAALAALREAGATPVEAIKAIRAVLGVDLAEAKKIFSTCPAWILEVKAGEHLHQEVELIIAQNKNL